MYKNKNMHFDSTNNIAEDLKRIFYPIYLTYFNHPDKNNIAEDLKKAYMTGHNLIWQIISTDQSGNQTLIMQAFKAERCFFHLLNKYIS